MFSLSRDWTSPTGWGSAGVGTDTQELIDYVIENNRNEGVNTLSVFVYKTPGESAEGVIKVPGNLSNAQLRQLAALRDASPRFVDDTSSDISFNGDWVKQDDGMDFRGSTSWSAAADNYAELAFTGTGVEVVVRKGSNGGLVDVVVDGAVVVDDFDTYASPTAYKQIIYDNQDLSAGSHTIRLVATGQKNASATKADAMLDYFAITKADTTAPRVLSIMSDATHPTKDPFTVTIAFLEEVTGLTAGEIAVSNGTGANLAGTGASYTLDIESITNLEGDVTVRIPADVAVDGANNGNVEWSETFAVDTTAPAFQNAAVDGVKLTLAYNEELDQLSVPPTRAFTVTGGNQTHTITGVRVSGSSVELTLTPAVEYGETDLRVSYTPGTNPVRDVPGNQAEGLRQVPVTNDTPVPPPTVQLEVSPDAINENGGRSTLTVELSHPSRAETTVTVSAAPTDAVTLNPPPPLTIPAGQTRGTVTLTAVDNTIDAPDKRVQVTATAENRLGVTGPAAKTLTIEDDDEPPTVTLHLSASSISEDGQESSTVTEGTAVAFTLTRTGATTNALTVNVQVTQTGTVIKTADSYQAPTTVAFGVGAATATLTVETQADEVDAVNEVNGTITAEVTAGTGYTLGTTVSATVTVTDDDDPQVEVSFVPGSYTATEGGTAATVTVTLAPDPERTVTIPLETLNRDGATDADYMGVPASVTFTSGGPTAQTFPVTATDDTEDDDGETVELDFGTLPSGVSKGSPGTAIVTIADNDDPAVTVAFDSATSTVTEGWTVDVLVTLSADPERTVTIPVEASPAASGDYAIPGSVTFDAGETQKPVNFATVDDTLVESAETFTLSFGSAPTGRESARAVRPPPR